ncbi:Coiled-coil domain-containing protein 17 [Desmophyllum pertusum]|uniref:Coiled-coil domain-containing protein 17 n=1 Tax=Desmophyllum pertusum TaxID=174260 RepID=A0A9W9ZRN2_9CNID|nr:Coiled-coil domain-containing protein 17 [Desmophyllum pertusum]
MIKRQPIRTRDAIKLIGDGQEQKLKKDRVIESWIKTRLTRSIDALPGDLGLSYIALYHVMHGLKISVDAAQNLPWANFTMVTLLPLASWAFYKGAREDPLNLVNKTAVFKYCRFTCLGRRSKGQFINGATSQVFPRRVYNRFMIVIIHLHELILDTSQTKTSYSLQGQAWTAVQVFDEGYATNGCYQLPLYTGDPPEVLSPHVNDINDRP